MNKEQQELLDEVCQNYEKEIIRQRQIQKEEVDRLRSQGKRVRVSLIELLTQEEFINKCKTDPEFSKKWGLKIEERELSFEERWKFYYKKEIDINNKHGEWDSFKDSSTKNLNSLKIPTKLITITYNDKTIESYE